MPDLNDLPPLREVIRVHGLRAEKALGQNFLLDLNLTDKIVRQAGDLSGCDVFEIGPGPGGLTRSLLKSGAESVTAVEYDPRAVQALAVLQECSNGRLNVLHADALETNLPDLAGNRPICIVANLPYNIATPLLIEWLRHIREQRENWRSMTLMFQKEVAQRIVADAGSKAYGRLSILSQWLCRCKIVMEIPPSAFTPPPKVTSCVVHFEPNVLPVNSPPFEAVENVTAAAFNQRRKMIRTSLKTYADTLESLCITPDKRAEQLTPAMYIQIAGKKQ